MAVYIPLPRPWTRVAQSADSARAVPPSTSGGTRAQDEELANVLADVRRGIWREPTPTPVAQEPAEEPTFHVFASKWLADKIAEGLAARTIEDYRWALEVHPLPFFASCRLSQISKRLVDDYKAAKAAEGALAPNTINKTLVRLSSILGDAVDYDIIPSNPAAGRRRRLKGTRPSRAWVTPEQVPALLEAAKSNRPLVATLIAAGLRVSEATALVWADINLARGTLRVRESKTAAGVRTVDLTPALREILVEHKARASEVESGDLVFTTRFGTPRTRQNVRRRVLMPAIESANKALAAAGIEPIGSVSPHGLRRTFASLREACGDPPSYVARQIGHVDARFTLNVYVQSSEHRDRLDDTARMAYSQAIEWARMGTNSAEPTLSGLMVEIAEAANEPH